MYLLTTGLFGQFPQSRLSSSLNSGGGDGGRDVLRAVDHGGQLHPAGLKHGVRRGQRGHLQPQGKQQLGRMPEKGERVVKSRLSTGMG